MRKEFQIKIGFELHSKPVVRFYKKKSQLKKTL